MVFGFFQEFFIPLAELLFHLGWERFLLCNHLFLLQLQEYFSHGMTRLTCRKWRNSWGRLKKMVLCGVVVSFKTCSLIWWMSDLVMSGLQHRLLYNPGIFSAVKLVLGSNLISLLLGKSSLSMVPSGDFLVLVFKLHMLCFSGILESRNRKQFCKVLIAFQFNWASMSVFRFWVKEMGMKFLSFEEVKLIWLQRLFRLLHHWGFTILLAWIQKMLR